MPVASALAGADDVMVPVETGSVPRADRRGMRVLLATDNADLGHALTLFLGERSIRVVDVVDDADGLARQTASRRPDVVLVDWHLGEAVAARMVADLADADDPTPVIVLSTTHAQQRARAAGASAGATLGDPPDNLLAAIREIGAGGTSTAGRAGA
jgi:DNA-binding NarL/FixJ family response regulator